MITLCIDPGAKAGYCLTDEGLIMWCGYQDTGEFEPLVVKTQPIDPPKEGRS